MNSPILYYAQYPKEVTAFLKKEVTESGNGERFLNQVQHISLEFLQHCIAIQVSLGV